MQDYSGLQKVTLTGADDTCHPSHLIQLSERFSIVEWGILIGSNQGTSRFPSAEWIQSLADLSVGMEVICSLHICGSALRSILNGDKSSAARFEFLKSLGIFSRCQLNFHGEPVSTEQADNIMDFLDGNPFGDQVIVQLDGVNDWLLSDLSQVASQIISGLFDKSHGAGVLPDSWPVARKGYLVGYAGGLGPINLKDQLIAINSAANGQAYWIDMETSLYDQGTGDFSYGKCREVLEIVSELTSAKK